MIDSEKQRLRQRMRELSLLHRVENSGEHRRIILNHKAWQGASTVLLYSPLPGEPDPTLLFSERAPQSFLFPRIEGTGLGLYRMGVASRWIRGPFGLKEPDPETWETAAPGEIDLAFIPGLAFDPAGGRLGRGRGYYDRLLGHPGFRGVKIGLCWDWQVVPSVPRGPLDIVMDAIITEKTTFFGKDRSGSVLDKPDERE